MGLDDVLGVVIREAQQNSQAALHSADGWIHKREVVVARPAAVAPLDARSVILGEGDAEGLLHLPDLDVSNFAMTVFPRDVLPAHLFKPEGEAARMADRLVYRRGDQLHAAKVLMMMPSQTWNLLLVAVNGSKLLRRESGRRHLTSAYRVRERSSSLLKVQRPAPDPPHGARKLRVKDGDVVENREASLIEHHP